MKSVLYICTLSLLLLASCEKAQKNDDPLSPYTNYAFQNKVGGPITVRIEDTATGEVFYMDLGPNESKPIPLSWQADGGRIRPLTYYWATKDLEMSSWYTTSQQDLRKNAEATYSNGRYIYTIPITPVYKSKRMKYFLNGIDGPTTWVAVDAYDSAGKSIWNTLGNEAKTHEIKLDYKKTGTHDHANSKGATTRDYFYYDLHYPNDFKPSFDIYMRTGGYSSADTSIHANYFIEMYNNLAPYHLPSFSFKSADTMFMVIKDKPPYYKMAKQPAS